MTIELSEDELEIIKDWYSSASGESASGLEVSPISQYREEYKSKFYEDALRARNTKALLDKLGIEMEQHSEYCMRKAGLL